MSEAKKPAKASSKRIIDVAQPGKSAPAATSKPVLITNRPILKDPMVVEGSKEATEEPVADEVKKLSSTTRIKLQPLDTDTEAKADEAETKTAESETTSALETTAEKTDLPAEKPAEAVADTAKATAEPDAPKEKEPDTDKALAPNQDAAENKTTPDAKPAATKTTDSETEKTDEVATEEGAEADNTTPDAADAKAAEEAAKHDAAIQALADSKKFYLPVNAVEKRRTKRFVLLGVLLSLLLVVAWVDIAADASLVKLGSKVPHTHLFGQQNMTATVISPPAKPTATYKAFSSPASLLTFHYPAAWQFSNHGSATVDNVNLDPHKLPTTADFSNGSVEVLFGEHVYAGKDAPHTVKVVRYQKLAHSINGAVYLRDLVYQDADGTINVTSSLSNDNTTKVGQTLQTTNETFTDTDGATKVQFFTDVIKVAGTKVGFSSIQQAQAYLNSSTYQQARSILLSVTPTKS